MPKATTQVCCICGADPKASPSFTALLEPFPASSSPDIARLLSTNDVPQDAHIPVIQQIISGAEERLRALDAYILPLQAALAQLVQQRADIAEHLREHRAILSPVRRVPPELVCEIFDLSTAQSRDRIPPWQLGCISRTWRHYAVEYPPLWSYLTVPHFDLDENEITACLPALESQLCRSGTALLDIAWPIDNRSPDSRILDLLLPHSNSWRTVAFWPEYDDAVLDWLEPVRSKLDSLQKLQVSPRACRQPVPDVFTTAPNLHQVRLPSIRLSGGDSPLLYRTFIPVPWKQITHYRGDCQFAQHVEILRSAPNLANCALYGIEYTGSIAARETPLVLPQLRRLCLDWDGFLLPIVASNLEELCCPYSNWIIPRILPFVWRASCTLQRLILWECPLSAELTITLRDLPSLTYLLLVNGRHDEADGLAFFATMHVYGTTTDIRPHLKSMVYGYVHWDSRESHDSFIRMARSRFEASASRPSATVLNSLRLLSCSRYLGDYSPPDADFKARIRSLQNERFNVAFLGEGETAEYLRCREF
ncbi:F-box domain-containing protein [Mycena sanguinolenta]|uniref:F-box domain-containing protein n=1 Tax=Mycena sanguinolenta TaxID=230812 RepID=A0A8H6XU74_9AGAR|nr:F-box domain-containing protein [Mycena sanguinolenta]